MPKQTKRRVNRNALVRNYNTMDKEEAIALYMSIPKRENGTFIESKITTKQLAAMTNCVLDNVSDLELAQSTLTRWSSGWGKVGMVYKVLIGLLIAAIAISGIWFTHILLPFAIGGTAALFVYSFIAGLLDNHYNNNKSVIDDIKVSFYALVSTLKGMLTYQEEQCKDLERRNSNLRADYTDLRKEMNQLEIEISRTHMLIESYPDIIDEVFMHSEDLESKLKHLIRGVSQKYQIRLNEWRNHFDNLKKMHKALIAQTTALMADESYKDEMKKKLENILSEGEDSKKMYEDYMLALHSANPHLIDIDTGLRNWGVLSQNIEVAFTEIQNRLKVVNQWASQTIVNEKIEKDFIEPLKEAEEAAVQTKVSEVAEIIGNVGLFLSKSATPDLDEKKLKEQSVVRKLFKLDTAPVESPKKTVK